MWHLVRYGHWPKWSEWRWIHAALGCGQLLETRRCRVRGCSIVQSKEWRL